MADLVTMPKLGFDMAEGTLIRWVIPEGKEVKKGGVLAEIETDKATVEVESQFTGIVYKYLVKEKDSVPVGTPIAIVALPGEKVDEKRLLGEGIKTVQEIPPKSEPVQKTVSPAPVVVASPPTAISPDMEERISPLARKMAKDAGLDVHLIQGSGPNGRIVKKDIDAAIQTGTSKKSITSPLVTVEQATKIPSHLNWQPAAEVNDQVLPVQKLRSAIGRKMSEAKQQIPHFYVTHDYDVEALLQVRSEANSALGEEHKLSVNDFIVKAVALTLRQFANLNSTLQEGKIIRYGHIHIGVAVSVPGGLMTVVCKDADQKPLRTISTEVKEMAARARSGKVHPEDIDGSTFSMSNLGMYDVEDFIAIINPPEAAILAVASARKVAVVQNDKVVPGWRMKATLSADHRITDGVEAAQFMQLLAEYLSNPVGLMI
jgi:pyruvate dehydrogenase E2 component (dihydrolipoamide acetyltransferase)